MDDPGRIKGVPGVPGEPGFRDILDGPQFDFHYLSSNFGSAQVVDCRQDIYLGRN